MPAPVLVSTLTPLMIPEASSVAPASEMLHVWSTFRMMATLMVFVPATPAATVIPVAVLIAIELPLME